MITYIVLSIGVLILMYVTYKSMKKFSFGGESVNLIPESKEEFSKIENEKVKNQLIERRKEFIDSDQSRDDYNNFSDDVDEIVEDLEVDATRIKAYLIEDYYNEKY